MHAQSNGGSRVEAEKAVFAAMIEELQQDMEAWSLADDGQSAELNTKTPLPLMGGSNTAATSRGPCVSYSFGIADDWYALQLLF